LLGILRSRHLSPIQISIPSLHDALPIYDKALERIKHIISFATVLFLGAVLLFGGAYGLQQQVDAVFLSGQYIVLCVFFYGVTVFVYTSSYLGMVHNPDYGVDVVVGGITLIMLSLLS